MGIRQSSNKLNLVGYIYVEPVGVILDVAKYHFGIGVESNLVYFHVYFFEDSRGSLCS